MEQSDGREQDPPLTPTSYVNALAAERHLREALVDVRLVAEVNLEGENYQLACAAMADLVPRRLEIRLGTLYPATTAVYLVAEGVHRYQGGAYWPQLTVSGIDQIWMGPAFLKALEQLGLPTFEHETTGGFRYIAKILLHGGIPRYCAGDVLRKLIEELRRGAADAREIVSKWRQSRWDLVGIDVPAQRFLLHAGDEAVDLIDRIVEMVQRGAEGRALDATALGLPAYLLTEYEALASSERRVGRRIIPPRPTLTLDPYTGEGPELRLPQADSNIWLRWNVHSASANRVRTFEVSRHRAHRLPVDPPAVCTVECLGAQQRVSYELGGPPRLPVLFFDAGNGTLLRDQDRLRGETVLVVAPETIAFRQGDALGDAVIELQELPPLHGRWSRHRVRFLDLRGLAAVWAGTATPNPAIPSTEATLVVTTAAARPSIVQKAVAGAESAGRCPIFSEWPIIAIPSGTRAERWRYRAMIDGVAHGGMLTEFACTPRGYDLGSVWGSLPLANVDLEVLGPLGSDVRTSFAVVDGFHLSMPEKVLGPAEVYDVLLRVSERLTVAGVPIGQIATLRSESITEQVEIVDERVGSRMAVSITVPRLQWSLRRRGISGLFGDEPFSITIDEIGERDDEAVLVRTARPVPARLALIGPGGELQSEGPIETQGQEGRWAFPLARMLTTARSSAAPRLQLVLEIDGTSRYPIGNLLAHHEVSSLQVESLVEGPETLLIARWAENRAFHNRELRLWSTARPWAAPTILPIPDSACGRFEVLVEQTVPPGVYTAEVAVGDGWLAPVRPSTARADIARFPVGRAADAEARLRSLNPEEPHHYLELLLAGRLTPSAPLPGALSGLYPDLLITLLDVLAAEGWRTLDSPTIKQLRAALFEEPDYIPPAIDRLVSEGRLSSMDALRLAILTLTDSLDCPLQEVDATTRARLHRDAPILGAALDGWPLDDAGIERWERYVGWSPCPDGPPPFLGGPIQSFMLEWKRDRILALKNELSPGLAGGLASERFTGAMLEWLSNESPSFTRTLPWRNAHNTLYDRLVKQDPLQAKYLAALDAGAAPNAAKFPPTLLAAAFQAVSFSGQNLKATRALLEAVEFAPSLVQRSLLVAIVHHRGGLS